MFQKATRKKVKLKLAITGPSGSGKSFSALRLSMGLGGKVAFIDTENGSASLYSDRFSFDVMELSPPYLVTKYIDAINAAIDLGYETIIIDSLSHAWAGEGGILQRKSDYDLQGKGNSYTNWAKFSKEQEFLNSKILNANANIIVTMRSKQDYQMIEDDKGKSKVQKLGLAPIQRDGMEYEFTTVFDVQMSHKAEASKDRTGLFIDQIFQITEDTGKILRKWVDSGVEQLSREDTEKLELIAITDELINKIQEDKQLAAYQALAACTTIDQVRNVNKRVQMTIQQ